MNNLLDTQSLLYTVAVIVKFIRFACLLGDRDNTGLLIGHMGKYLNELLQILVNGMKI